MYPADEIQDKKRTFALAFIKTPLDAMAAAFATDPRHNYAMWIANEWQFDPEVQDYMDEAMQEHGVAAGIPTKEELAVKIYSTANGLGNKDVALKYYDLLAKMLGYVDKPGSNTTVNVAVDNRKVLFLPEPKQLDDWETQAVAQQKAITA